MPRNRAEAGGQHDDARRDAPEKRANAAHGRDAETVKHHPDRHLKDGIGPEEGAEQEPDFDRRQSEFLLELRGSD